MNKSLLSIIAVMLLAIGVVNATTGTLDDFNRGTLGSNLQGYAYDGSCGMTGTSLNCIFNQVDAQMDWSENELMEFTAQYVVGGDGTIEILTSSDPGANIEGTPEQSWIVSMSASGLLVKCGPSSGSYSNVASLDTSLHDVGFAYVDNGGGNLTANTYLDGSIVDTCTIITTGTLTHYGIQGTDIIVDNIEITALNTAPSIISRTPTINPNLTQGDIQSFSVSVTDPDNQSLTYTWLLDSVNQSVNSSSFDLDTSSLLGSYSLELVVDDGEANDSTSWSVVVNEAPTGYQGTYESDDISTISVDFVARAGITIVSFATVIGLLLFANYTRKKLK